MRRFSRRRTRRIALIAGVVVIAGLTAAGYGPTQRAIERRERLVAGSELRGIAQGMCLYMGSNGGQRPPADRWQEPLIAGGYATTAMFAPRRGVGGYERYTLLPERESKWGTSFNANTAMIVENPAAWGGEGGNVAYNDNHVIWMSAEDCAALIAGGEARGPVEFPPPRMDR